jgi:hypothetical protein
MLVEEGVPKNHWIWEGVGSGGATKHASSNRKLPRQGDSGKGKLLAFDVGPPCIGPNVRGVYDNPNLSYAGTG